MKNIRFIILLTGLVFFNIYTIKAQDSEEDAYTKTLHQRAGKILEKLDIQDNAVKSAVLDIIVNQYRELGKIHDGRDQKVKAIKDATGIEKQTKEEQIRTIENTASLELNALHYSFVARLSARLTPTQVEGVKDGMTFNVLPITYKGYLDMLVNLTHDQKIFIMESLIEAREYAMDAESSERKHWWFGKYKGRINNYLSAEGYDLKKESEEWHKRMAATEKTDKTKEENNLDISPKTKKKNPK